ncbi:MAG: ChrR family anti-sigma-E factor [Hyphomicrobiaceae bacterium]|nr:ChrR family anti-sigma-E factor [Hyphomicrobiaceae bacterium]
MNVHHHLDGATLLRYAAGDLDEAFSVVVAAHLAMCAECRRAVHLAEEMGGRLLDETDEVDMSAGAFERLMAQIAADGDRAPEKREAAVVNGGDVPLPLRRFVGSSLDEISWKTISPGVRRHAIELATAPDSSLYMLHIAAGKAVPEHGHGGSEMTLVLSGAYRDELGRFGPGDIADLDEHVEHQPKVEAGAPCICLVATEAPTRYKGFFSRLLQPLVGI